MARIEEIILAYLLGESACEDLSQLLLRDIDVFA